MPATLADALLSHKLGHPHDRKAIFPGVNEVRKPQVEHLRPIQDTVALVVEQGMRQAVTPVVWTGHGRAEMVREVTGVATG